MDPLSISTSIAGVIGIAGTIISTLESFTSKIKNAPQSARFALFTLKEMKLALVSTEKLLSSLGSLQQTRKELIQLDHLVIAVTQSVATLVELQSLVCPTGISTAKLERQSTQKSYLSEPHLISTTSLIGAADILPADSLRSDLEEGNDSLLAGLSFWDRLKWVWKDADILRAIRRLEGHKSSISLMLNILQW